MHCTSCALKRKVGKPLLFKQTLRSRFTCPACRHFSFHAKKSLDRKRPFSLGLRVVSLLSCLSRLAPSVTRVVICVSRAFCSTDQDKRENFENLQRDCSISGLMGRKKKVIGSLRKTTTLLGPLPFFFFFLPFSLPSP